MRTSISILLCLASVACNGATITVGPGKTHSTISAAAAAASADDTVEVYTANYTEYVTASRDRLTITAAAGNTPVLTGRIIANATNLTVRGLVITGWTNAYAGGVHSYQQHGLTVENCIIRNGVADTSGVYVRDAGNILIRSNVIHGCASGVNINSGQGSSFETGTRIISNVISSNYFDGIDANCVYLTIDQNVIFNNFDTNWVLYHPDGIQYIDSTVDGQRGVQHSRITRNLVYNHPQNIFTANFTTNCVIANNICYAEAGTVNGLDLDTVTTKNIALYGGTNIWVFNNTLGRSANSSIYLNYEVASPRTGAIIRNNIITDSIGIGFYCVDGADLSMSDNNLYYNNLYAARIGATYYDTLADFQAATIYEDSGVDSDPLLTAWVPSSISPAIDAGFDGSAMFTTDFTGATRSAPWDIGAYEHQASGRATATSATVGTLTIQ